jgi:hypothetical protein
VARRLELDSWQPEVAALLDHPDDPPDPSRSDQINAEHQAMDW